MIKTEIIDVNGKTYVRSWSDCGKILMRGENKYEEAIDPAEYDRVYVETDEDFEVSEGSALAELVEVLQDEEI